jgi:hypothetical protein
MPVAVKRKPFRAFLDRLTGRARAAEPAPAQPRPPAEPVVPPWVKNNPRPAPRGGKNSSRDLKVRDFVPGTDDYTDRVKCGGDALRVRAKGRRLVFMLRSRDASLAEVELGAWLISGDGEVSSEMKLAPQSGDPRHRRLSAEVEPGAVVRVGLQLTNLAAARIEVLLLSGGEIV